MEKINKIKPFMTFIEPFKTKQRNQNLFAFSPKENENPRSVKVKQSALLSKHFTE